jgi:diaminopimelate epimerase
MQRQFYKLHSLGNDFVMVFTQANTPVWSRDVRVAMADRHRGIGYDQLLWVSSPEQVEAPFDVRIFNADGSESFQCLNGLRAVACLLEQLVPNSAMAWQLQTGSGRYWVSAKKEGYVAEAEGSLQPADLPFLFERQQSLYVLNLPQVGEVSVAVASLGNPHVVLPVGAALGLNRTLSDVELAAKALSQSPLFPEGVNVGICEKVGETALKLRVLERGAGWTQACGSGACALAMVARDNAWISGSAVTIAQPGGTVEVAWRDGVSAVRLTGPVVWVFDGSWRG